MNGNEPPRQAQSTGTHQAHAAAALAGVLGASPPAGAEAAWLRSIVDALPALVAYVAADETYRFVSRKYELWFDQRPESLVGRTLREVLGETAYQGVSPHVAAVLRGQTVSFEARLEYRHVGRRWVKGSYLPDLDETGKVRGFVSLVLDVSDQKDIQEQLSEEVRVKEGLARLGAALLQDLDLETMFQRLTDEATSLCRAQFGAFFYNVTRPGAESYMLYTIAGVPREAFSKFPMPRNTAVFAPTFEGTSIVRSDDITQDPRYGKNAPRKGMPEGHLPVRSYLAVPVVSRAGKVHGGLFFGHERAGVFSERDELALVTVAAQAAIAIDNAELHAATTLAEQRYRALSESAPLLVWTTGPGGTLEYVNRRFLEYTGRTLGQLIAGDPESILHPADEAQFSEAWSKSLRDRSPLEAEYRLRRADGVYRWFLARGVPAFDAQGNVTRWIGSSTDIDDRKRAEESQRFLAEVGALLSASLDYKRTFGALARMVVPLLADGCAIDVLGEEGKFVHAAHSSSESRTLLESHVYHLHGESLTRANVLRRVVEGCARLASTDPASTPSATAADDGLHWLMVPLVSQQRALGVLTLASWQTSFPLDAQRSATAEDLARRMASVLENATLYQLAQHEQKRAEDASRAKDLFLSTLSHELRTPLSAILGWTRLLQSGTLSEEKRDRALSIVERNARVQAAMIEDVLDLARITSGKLRLEVSPVDVTQIVDAAIDTIRPSADAKGVRLQAVLEADGAVLHGDGPRLQQVAWNLLSNAVKFTPKGGRIYVLVRKVDSAVEIVVSDTGAGIPSEFLPHVFERFTQADPTRTRQHGGLGLGLSIVRHLTELHGGTVSADSGGAGLGATFTVRLPVSPVRDTPVNLKQVSAPNALARSAASPQLSGLHVLVVDDEPDARELVQSVLQLCGARVSVAQSARDAFELLVRDKPQVLLSDIGMPEEDGYSLIRKVRALAPEDGGRIPAVALTAYAQIADRTRALMEGFNNHISKPAEPEELIAVVAALAGRYSHAAD